VWVVVWCLDSPAHPTTRTRRFHAEALAFFTNRCKYQLLEARQVPVYGNTAKPLFGTLKSENVLDDYPLHSVLIQYFRKQTNIYSLTI